MRIEQSKKVFQNENTRRIALNLQYDGSEYCGWQRQVTGLSVQGLLEKCISFFESSKTIKSIAAGRTDAGVHAAGQVVHFDCSGTIPASRWSQVLNGRLPKSIRVLQSVIVPNEWHACYSAVSRRYRYTIYNGRKPNLFVDNWSWHRYQFRLDDDVMNSALKSLVGIHDFTAFQRSGSKRADAFTTIQEVCIKREGDFVFIEVQASGFLYGMVRLLVGQLVALGEHRLSLELFNRRWQQKRRDEVKESAPAKGLCLLRVGYEIEVFSKACLSSSLPIFYLSGNDSPQIPPQFK